MHRGNNKITLSANLQHESTQRKSWIISSSTATAVCVWACKCVCVCTSIKLVKRINKKPSAAHQRAVGRLKSKGWWFSVASWLDCCCSHSNRWTYKDMRIKPQTPTHLILLYFNSPFWLMGMHVGCQHQRGRRVVGLILRIFAVFALAERPLHSSSSAQHTHSHSR